MRKILHLSLFLMLSPVAFGQTANESLITSQSVSVVPSPNVTAKTYKIYYGNQLVELMRGADGSYSGDIICATYPMHLDAADAPLLKKKYPIQSSTVQKLMERLNNERIETLPNSRDLKNYGTWTEGETVKFEITTSGGSRSYTYDCPYGNLWDARFQEINHVRALLKALRTELQLGKVFAGYIESLPAATFVSNGNISVASRLPGALNQTKSNLKYANVSALFSIWNERPEFPGGDTALIAFLSQNIKNIELNPMSNKIQVISASFLVGKDGILTAITSATDALYSAPNPKYEAEVIRVIKRMPPWIPGKRDGQIAQIRYSFNVYFKP